MAPRSNRPGWVDWAKCPAWEVILDDLRPGGPLYQRNNIPAEEIFPWYKKLPAFETVVFSQFKERLKDHQNASEKDIHRAMQEEQYLVHNQALYPRETQNARGEVVFDMSPAKALLRADIKNDVHLTTHKTAGQLQNSRDEYKVFKKRIFYERIRQEIKRNKYFHYLEVKREKLRKGF